MSKLAILGGEKTRQEEYPQWPVFDDRDINAVTEVVKSGQWGGFPYPGPNTVKFLERFAEMQGGGYPALMVNGTVTMEVALRAADIGWGDEVIVPALTFQATAAAPMAAGAIPVLVDVDPGNYCMDPVKIEAAITPRTRAIIPVHLGAQMADMDAIMAIAERYNLIVVEDCAHAHGAKWRGRGAGTIGHFGSFSLQSSKILTTGEGGILICRTEEYQKKVESIINCGRPYEQDGKLVYTMGANYRLGEFQAALGVVGLERFPEQVKQRNEAANYLEEALSEVPGVRLLRRDPRHTTRTIYEYGFAIDPSVFHNTNHVVCAALEAEGIPCDSGYQPMNRYDLFQPGLSKLPIPSAFPERFDYSNTTMLEAERAAGVESVWLSESVFRDGQKGVDDFVSALKKVLENGPELAKEAAALQE
jgi:L-glutamine:2-deoxy-scyllo-inosose/3-amino-2,3-dideoxy-scyllo-inosose aminotransferase